MNADFKTGDFSVDSLKAFHYKDLQRLAKSLKLPSNVKKIHMVQLIYAKKYLTNDHIENIIHLVRMERRQIAFRKKQRNNLKTAPVQYKEISSTNTPSVSQSQPVHVTRKQNLSRTNTASQEQPGIHSLLKVEPNSCSRVLRSTDVKTYPRQNNSLLDRNSILNQIGKVTPDEAWRLRSHRLSLLFDSQSRNKGKQLDKESLVAPRSVGPSSELQTKASGAPPPPRPRPPARPRKRTATVVGYRNINGEICKIKLQVPKRTSLEHDTQNVPKNLLRKAQSDADVTVQDIINSRIDAETITSSKSDVVVTEASSDYNHPAESTLAEMITEQNGCSTQHPLPKGTAVGSKCGSFKCEGERESRVDVPEGSNNLVRRRAARGNRLKLQPRGTCGRERGARGGRGGRGRPPRTATTAVAQPPALAPAAVHPALQLALGGEYVDQGDAQFSADDMATMECALAQGGYDFITHRFGAARCGLYPFVRARERAPAAAAPAAGATTEELMQDALEYIAEDGDYWERIIEEQMSCILCSWAVPKFMLESHIREEHADKIVEQNKNTWNTTIKLSSLINQEQWLSHVAELQSELYILSLKYQDPDCLMVTLTNLSSYITSKSGIITIYNKITGEPYSWSGNIQELPTTMPYCNTKLGLELGLSKLDLLPNSANLKLVNRELVFMSPSRTVVGKPDLNDMHIIVFVNIFD